MAERRLTEDQVHRQAQSLRDSLRTVMLATVSAEGEPDASYAPFVEYAGSFYVLVSGLSQHTANLIATAKVGLLFAEPEHRARQIFARRRLSYRCAARLIERNDDEWQIRLDQLGARFGGIVNVLRDLPDFRLFQLTPREGVYVRGFGQAYTLKP